MFIRRLLYFIIVAISALVLNGLCASPNKYWLIWSAFSLSLITFGDTFIQRIVCLLLTGMMMATVVFVVGFTIWVVPLLISLIVLMTLLLTYGMNKRKQYWLPLLLINIFVLLGISPTDLLANVDRAILILLGTLIALVPQVLFWPHFVSNQIKYTLIDAIRSLQNLSNEVFNILLQADYPDKLYLYEKRIHTQKMNVLNARQRLRELIEKNKKIIGIKSALLSDVLAQLDLLYESFINCAQVRWRTTDHTIFAVCQQDLIGIVQEMNKAYDEFISNLTTKNTLHADFAPLSVTINRFEQTYQNVLQVTAREPMVLLLFVANLQMFAVELTAFNIKLAETRMVFK